MLHAMIGGAIGLVLGLAGAVAMWNRPESAGVHMVPHRRRSTWTTDGVVGRDDPQPAVECAHNFVAGLSASKIPSTHAMAKARMVSLRTVS